MPTNHATVAQRLRAAYAEGPVAPLRDGLNPLDEAGAYSVQAINTQFWLAGGRRIVGRKIGLTAEAVQKQLGVSRPDYGVLFDDMRISNRGDLLTSRVLQPRAEGEVAIILAKDLKDPNATYETVLNASQGAVAAIEIVDSRIADWKITFADTVADNGSAAFFVLGEKIRSLANLDLRTCGMAMEINGRLASHGTGVACLGHPLIAAAWLARTVAQKGEGLKAGDIILTGALGPMVALTPDDIVEAAIEDLGKVGFNYKSDRR